MLIGLMLVILGLFLIIHDILFHLGIWRLEIGKPFYLFGKIRIYHAYVGLIFVLLGLLIIKNKKVWFLFSL